MSDLPPPGAPPPGDLPPPSPTTPPGIGLTPPGGQPQFGPPPSGPVVPVQTDGEPPKPWWKGPAGVVAAAVVVVALIGGIVALTRSGDETTTTDTRATTVVTVRDTSRRTTPDTQAPATRPTRPPRTDPGRTDEPTVTERGTDETVDTQPSFSLPPLTDPASTAGSSTEPESTDVATTDAPTTGVLPPGGEATLADSDGTLRVALLAVVDNAPARQYSEPDAGHKFVAVQIRIVNGGSKLYTDTPAFGATLIDTANQQFDAGFIDADVGPEMSSVAIRPGDVRIGWITFEVPSDMTPSRVQIKRSFSFNSSPARWDVTASPQTPPPAPAVLAPDTPLKSPATLTDTDENKVDVSVVQLVDPVTAEYGSPAADHRYLAVQVSFANKGPGQYSGFPDLAVSMIDGNAQAYTSALIDSSAGPGFGGTVELAPGDSRVGFVVFELPNAQQPAKVQVQLDSGFSDEVAEFAVG